MKEASRRRRKSLGWVFARGTKERVFQAVWTAPVKVWVNEQHGAFGTPQGFFWGGHHKVCGRQQWKWDS